MSCVKGDPNKKGIIKLQGVLLHVSRLFFVEMSNVPPYSVSYLVEQGVVDDGDTEEGETSAQDHVVRSVVTIATASTGKQPGHSRPTEHHPSNTKK